VKESQRGVVGDGGEKKGSSKLRGIKSLWRGTQKRGWDRKETEKKMEKGADCQMKNSPQRYMGPKLAGKSPEKMEFP